MDAYQPAFTMIFPDVVDRNLGALDVLTRLQHRSKWSEIMSYLQIYGPKGSEVWKLYKDVHGQDLIKFGDDILERMKAIKFDPSKEAVMCLDNQPWKD